MTLIIASAVVGVVLGLFVLWLRNERMRDHYTAVDRAARQFASWVQHDDMFFNGPPSWMDEEDAVFFREIMYNMHKFGGMPEGRRPVFSSRRIDR